MKIWIIKIREAVSLVLIFTFVTPPIHLHAQGNGQRVSGVRKNTQINSGQRSSASNASAGNRTSVSSRQVASPSYSDTVYTTSKGLTHVENVSDSSHHYANMAKAQRLALSEVRANIAESDRMILAIPAMAARMLSGDPSGLVNDIPEPQVERLSPPKFEKLLRSMEVERMKEINKARVSYNFQPEDGTCEENRQRSTAMSDKIMGWIVTLGGVGVGGFSLYKMLECQKKNKEKKQELADKQAADEKAAAQASKDLDKEIAMKTGLSKSESVELKNLMKEHNITVDEIEMQPNGQITAGQMSLGYGHPLKQNQTPTPTSPPTTTPPAQNENPNDEDGYGTFALETFATPPPVNKTQPPEETGKKTEPRNPPPAEAPAVVKAPEEEKPTTPPQQNHQDEPRGGRSDEVVFVPYPKNNKNGPVIRTAIKTSNGQRSVASPKATTSKSKARRNPRIEDLTIFDYQSGIDSKFLFRTQGAGEQQGKGKCMWWIAGIVAGVGVMFMGLKMIKKKKKDDTEKLAKLDIAAFMNEHYAREHYDDDRENVGTEVETLDPVVAEEESDLSEEEEDPNPDGVDRTSSDFIDVRSGKKSQGSKVKKASRGLASKASSSRVKLGQNAFSPQTAKIIKNYANQYGVDANKMADALVSKNTDKELSNLIGDEEEINFIKSKSTDGMTAHLMTNFYKKFGGYEGMENAKDRIMASPAWTSTEKMKLKEEEENLEQGLSALKNNAIASIDSYSSPKLAYNSPSPINTSAVKDKPSHSLGRLTDVQSAESGSLFDRVRRKLQQVVAQ